MQPLDTSDSMRGFRAKIVHLIIDGHPERALQSLAKYYEVSEPALRVGTVKRHRKVLACYVEKESRIYLSNSSFMTNPFVILHEFYHHLRCSGQARNRQVEKRADLFAWSFIRDFKRAIGESR
jgi:Zn-dependent peptidase ImmA (M78 family)